MEKPKVSTIIPTYNTGASIVRYLKSINNQSSSSVEVIIVDNLARALAMTQRVLRKPVGRTLYDKNHPRFGKERGHSQLYRQVCLFLLIQTESYPDVLLKNLLQNAKEKMQEW